MAEATETPKDLDNNLEKSIEQHVANLLSLDLDGDGANDIQNGVKETEVNKAKTAGGGGNDEASEYESDGDIHIDIPTRPKKKKLPPPEPEGYQTPIEELDNALKLFDKKKVLPPLPQRHEVIDYGKNLSIQAMISEEYDKASRIDAVVARLVQACQADQGTFDTSQKAKVIETRLSSVQTQTKQSEHDWNQKIAEFRSKEQEKIEQLIKNHEAEKSAFEADCQTPEFLFRFSKPSSKLLQLKKQQKTLAMDHDFEAAKIAKAEVDRLQAIETAEAQSRAIEAIKHNYQALLDRQAREIECAKALTERKIAEMQTSKEKELDANQKLVNQLEVRLKEAKASKKGSCLPPLGQSTPKNPGVSAKQMSQFRRSPEKMQLDVKIADIKGIFNNKKPRPASKA